MNAPSEDIKTILEAESSLGLTLATNLFISEMPDNDESPDECVAIMDSGGETAEPDYVYQKPFVSIQVRGNRGDYTVAYALADDIRTALHGLANYEIASSARYIGIWCEGDVIAVGRDQKKRPMFTVNFRMHRTTV